MTSFYSSKVKIPHFENIFYNKKGQKRNGTSST